jgi:hypothetical protein
MHLVRSVLTHAQYFKLTLVVMLHFLTSSHTVLRIYPFVLSLSLSLSLFRLVSFSSLLGDGTGTRMWYVAFEAAPTLLAQGGNEVDEPNSKIYKEYYEDGSKYGMAEVCVRASLQTPAGIEVNYMESILTIHYYFSNGFYILEDFQVERPEGM